MGKTRGNNANTLTENHENLQIKTEEITVELQQPEIMKSLGLKAIVILISRSHLFTLVGIYHLLEPFNKE